MIADFGHISITVAQEQQLRWVNGKLRLLVVSTLTDLETSMDHVLARFTFAML